MIVGDMVVTAQPSVTALMRPGRTRAVVNSHVTPTGQVTRTPDVSLSAHHINGRDELPVPDLIRDLVVARAAEAPDQIRGGQGTDGAVEEKDRWVQMCREITAPLDGDARFPAADRLAGRMMGGPVCATMSLRGGARQRGARSGCRRPPDSIRRVSGRDAKIRDGAAGAASGGLSGRGLVRRVRSALAPIAEGPLRPDAARAAA